jgi:hypothetical protein
LNLYFTRLKNKWGVESNSQFILIFIVFGITGSLSVRLAKPVLEFLNINNDFFKDLFLGDMLYWTLRVVIVFPLYQLLLLVIGTLFLQFKFFWNFEKKILCRIGFKRFFKK